MKWFSRATAGVVLVLLTGLAYVRVVNNGFIDYDDQPYIVRNQALPEGLSGAGVAWAIGNDESPYWMPVAWLSFLFDAQCFSTRLPHGERALWPAAFHLHSLLWHAAGALLLFLLLRRMTGKGGCSFLVAALFAVHPMHVESVAWAAERKDVLSVFFGILTLYMYLRYLEKPGRWRYLAMTAAYLLSLLSKPMLITLPLAMLLFDYWPLRRWRASSQTPPGHTGPVLRRPLARGLLMEKAPLFFMAALFAAITLATRDRHGSLVSFDNLPLTDRLANALTAYGWYVSATFFPIRLAALYPHPHDNWSPVGVLAGAVCLVLITAYAFWQARQRPWLIVGWAWFVISLAPVIGLAQGGVQAWADRFSYWPHIGFFVAIVWEAEWLAQFLAVPALVRRAAWATVIACLAALTWIQVGYWRDSTTLWEHTLAVTRNNDRAHEHLAVVYRQAGRVQEADFHLREATRIQQERRQFIAQQPRPQ